MTKQDGVRANMTRRGVIYGTSIGWIRKTRRTHKNKWEQGEGGELDGPMNKKKLRRARKRERLVQKGVRQTLGRSAENRTAKAFSGLRGKTKVNDTNSHLIKVIHFNAGFYQAFSP